MNFRTRKTDRMQVFKWKKAVGFPVFFITMLFTGCVESDSETKELVFEDDFSGDLSNWVMETGESDDAQVSIENGKLVIDVDRGATVWLDKELSGNIQIEYDRKVVMEEGKNDRLSDLNQFWMASDPKKKDLFTRQGVFKEYDSLQLYYFGVGGNRNTTTRLRKYEGNGHKTLLHDYRQEKHLLQPNKTYHIKTIYRDGSTKVYMDGEVLFSFEDKAPYTQGYFGFRTTESRHEIDNVKIYRIN